MKSQQKREMIFRPEPKCVKIPRIMRELHASAGKLLTNQFGQN
jgi:hypothetical protein